MPNSILKLCILLMAMAALGARATAQAKEYYNIMDASLYTGSGVNPAACDGSTDDTNAFQYIITNKAEPNQTTIVVPPGKTCVIGGTLNFSFSIGVCLVGGIGAPALPYGIPPMLKFTGQAQSTSSNGFQYPPSLINFGNSTGFCMKNLFLEYTNSSIGGAFLEGFAVKVGNPAQQGATSNPYFQNLLITSPSNSVNSATCLISLDYTINAVVDTVQFDRAQAGLCGVKQSSNDFSNANTVRNSFFNADGAITNSMILNAGSSWTIGPNNFFVPGTVNIPVFSVSQNFNCDAVSFVDNLIGDPAPSPNVNLLSIPNCSLTVRGNYFQGTSGSTAISMSSGTLVADGNTFVTVAPFSLTTGMTADVGVNEYVSTTPSFPTTSVGATRLFTFPQMTTLVGAVNTRGNLTVNGSTLLFGNMTVGGTLSKSAGAFKIDDPRDPARKYLYHSFVESPEMENIYDGIVTLDRNGEAVVKLPDYFEALNRDFHYHLSCIGGFAPVFVSSEIKDNAFHITGGRPGLKVSWMVSGIRHDAYANRHRIRVEEDKPPVSGAANPHATVGLSQPTEK